MNPESAKSINNKNMDAVDVPEYDGNASAPLFPRYDDMKTPASLADKYTFVCEIGHGSQAKVYLARRIKDSLPVTVKQLNIESVKTWKEYDLFHREAEVLSHLKIKGVAGFYEAIECLNDNPPCSYIVQEYVEGASLADMLKRGHRFTTAEAFDIIIQILKILQSLQMRDTPIIHRDIKPSNIMITPCGERYRITLIDFGAVANPQVQSGGSTVAGTYGYMPPEQLMGRPVPASDIYALGAVAVELLSGVSPATMQTKDFRLIFEPYVQHLQPAVVATLRSMLEKDVEHRLANIRDLLDIFNKYRSNNYEIIDIKSVNAEDNREINRKLHDIDAICKPGNMDLWQKLPEKTPRSIPEYYLQMLNARAAAVAATENKSKAPSATFKNIVIWILLSLFIVSCVCLNKGLYYPCFISFGLFLAALCVALVASVGLQKPPAVQVDKKVQKYGSKLVCELLSDGRKNVATIVGIEYIPIPLDAKLITSRKLISTDSVPAFRIKYKFNPPDDARAEDLVHEYICHAQPEQLYAVGDPLPILYIIRECFFGDSVYSMPYPYPAENCDPDELIYKSDSYTYFQGASLSTVPEKIAESYDFKTHCLPLIKANGDRNQMILALKADVLFINDFECLKIVLAIGEQIMSTSQYDVRCVFLVTLLKIYHFATNNRTQMLAYESVIRYLQSDNISSKELISIMKDYRLNLPDRFWDVYCKALSSCRLSEGDIERLKYDIPVKISHRIRQILVQHHHTSYW